MGGLLGDLGEEGEGEFEYSALADGAIGEDRASVGLHHTSGNGKPEAASTAFGGEEIFIEAVQSRRGDTTTGVSYHHDQYPTEVPCSSSL